MLSGKLYWFLYLIKMSSLLGPFLVTGYFLTNHDLSVLGEYALFNSYAVGISLISKFGFDILIEREASRSNIKNLTRYYSNAFITVIVLTAILSLILSSTILSFDRFGNFTPFIIVLWSLGYSINYLVNASLRARKYFYLATILLPGNISVFFISAITIFDVFSINQIFIILSISPFIVITLVLFISPYSWIVIRELKNSSAQLVSMEMLKQATDYFLINAMSFLRNAASFWFLGSFFTVEMVGMFRIVTQINTALNFPVVVANIFAPQKISHLWAGKHIDEIQRFACMIARSTLVLGSPMLILLLALYSELNNLLGLGVENIREISLIIILAQLFNLSTGANAALLTMTNYHRIARNNNVCTGIVFFITFILLVQNYDLLGATIAFSLAIFLDNLLCILSVRRYLGFWILPFVKETY